MPLIRNVECPNFDNEEIPVEFLVVHYTACTLEKTLEIFRNRERKVCSHFVINTDGSIYDLGHFWNGPIRRGAHAGVSRLEMDGLVREKFNDFSIGVEIVNFNGNFLEFSPLQYASLAKIVKQMSRRFILLTDPRHIVGHEQIAGFRGKIDPGIKFDWLKFYEMVFPGEPVPQREAILTPALLKEFEAQHGKIDTKKLSDDDWSALNSQLEEFVGSRK
jgi:N-acetyl-anhydromuramyl-L-alanine amidase AmpD